MVGVGETRKAAELTEYEKLRNANVQRNEKTIDALNLRSLAQEISSHPPKRKRKV